MAVSGQFPLVLESLTVGLLSMLSGAERISSGSKLPLVVDFDTEISPLTHENPLPTHAAAKSHGSAWSVVLPITAALAFASIFVLANPDLHQRVSEQLRLLSAQIRNFFNGFSIWELPFCIAALFVGAGLLRPLQTLLFGPAGNRIAIQNLPTEPAPLYPAFRNTLWTLIVLFAVYLAFEFMTLWKRDFPTGFYYAGYAHEGAAWLTLALALATLVLSLIFRGRTLLDPRRRALQSYAWLWTFETCCWPLPSTTVCSFTWATTA